MNDLITDIKSASELETIIRIYRNSKSANQHCKSLSSLTIMIFHYFVLKNGFQVNANTTKNISIIHNSFYQLKTLNMSTLKRRLASIRCYFIKLNGHYIDTKHPINYGKY